MHTTACKYEVNFLAYSDEQSANSLLLSLGEKQDKKTFRPTREQKQKVSLISAKSNLYISTSAMQSFELRPGRLSSLTH